jgi:hypothetical protein
VSTEIKKGVSSLDLFAKNSGKPGKLNCWLLLLLWY